MVAPRRRRPQRAKSVKTRRRRGQRERQDRTFHRESRGDPELVACAGEGVAGGRTVSRLTELTMQMMMQQRPIPACAGTGRCFNESSGLLT